MSLFRRALNGPREARVYDGVMAGGDLGVPPPWHWYSDEHVSAPIGDFQALRNMTVYGCVQLLANTIAMLPMKAYRDDGNGFPVEVSKAPKVIEQPVPNMTQYDFKWMMVQSLALRGNFYAYVTGRDENLWPTGLLPIHPDWVQVTVPGDPYTWVEPKYMIGGKEVSGNDVLHIKRFVQPGYPQGLSPIRQAAAAIGMALSVEEYGFRYFRDTANPSGQLVSSEVIPSTDAEEIQKRWIQSHGGRRLPAVLGGGFKWEPISISPEESQFLQTRQFQDNQIMRMFGIPPHMLGDHTKATSWGTGIEQLSIGFLTFTLNSWLACMEEPFSRILPRPQYVLFDTDVLLRGDTQSRWEAHQLARNIGARNADEIRAMEGQPPIPDGKGQVYWQPVNMAPAGWDPAQNAINAAKAHADQLAKSSGNDGNNQQQQPNEGSQQEGSGNAQSQQQK